MKIEYCYNCPWILKRPDKSQNRCIKLSLIISNIMSWTDGIETFGLNIAQNKAHNNVAGGCRELCSLTNIKYCIQRHWINREWVCIWAQGNCSCSLWIVLKIHTVVWLDTQPKTKSTKKPSPHFGGPDPWYILMDSSYKGETAQIVFKIHCVIWITPHTRT